jgi:photosystem II stability/assembly factor-like uncharacterized protein
VDAYRRAFPTAVTSPWQAIDLETQANPLDVSFTDPNHGFLVGSNRMIRETDDGGSHWNDRSLDLPDEENFRLISIDFEGPGRLDCWTTWLLMHSTDGGQKWTRLFLDTKLPGEPYLIQLWAKALPSSQQMLELSTKPMMVVRVGRPASPTQLVPCVIYAEAAMAAM